MPVPVHLRISRRMESVLVLMATLQPWAEMLPDEVHLSGKRASNRAENSHQPTRERERRMRGFKSAGHAQRFLATFGVVSSFFRPGRHTMKAVNYREIMRRRFAEWSQVVQSGLAFQ